MIHGIFASIRPWTEEGELTSFNPDFIQYFLAETAIKLWWTNLMNFSKNRWRAFWCFRATIFSRDVLFKFFVLFLILQFHFKFKRCCFVVYGRQGVQLYLMYFAGMPLKERYISNKHNTLTNTMWWKALILTSCGFYPKFFTFLICWYFGIFKINFGVVRSLRE